MTFKHNIAALTLLITITPSIAADIPTVSTGINGVWSTADGCHRLKLSKINPKALWKPGFEDISYLDGQGISGYEWSCHFVKGFEDTGVYLSNCELEGEGWSDVLKVKKLDTGGWSVTAIDDNDQPNEIVYDTMCRSSR